MMRVEQFQGFFPVLATPLTPDEKLDEPALRRLVERALVAGVDGIVVLGSAGEGPLLLDDVRRHVIEVAVDAVEGKVPVVVGTGDTSTRRAARNTVTAAKCGADAALIVPPFYDSPLNPRSIECYYHDLAQEGVLPIILYNMPQLTKVAIPLDSVKALSRVSGIIGIKDSSGDMAFFQKLVVHAGSTSFRVFQGRAPLAFASLAFGADGTMHPMGNIDPILGVELHCAIARGDWAAARKCQIKLMALASMVGYGAYPVCTGLKAILSIMDVCGPTVSSPLPSLAVSELEEIRVRLRELGLV